MELESNPFTPTENNLNVQDYNVHGPDYFCMWENLEVVFGKNPRKNTSVLL